MQRALGALARTLTCHYCICLFISSACGNIAESGQIVCARVYSRGGTEKAAPRWLTEFCRWQAGALARVMLGTVDGRAPVVVRSIAVTQEIGVDCVFVPPPPPPVFEQKACRLFCVWASGVLWWLSQGRMQELDCLDVGLAIPCFKLAWW